VEDYLDYALRLRAAGQPFVIATVVRAERPTSAKPGANAIVTADGRLTGWVGGSCAQPTVTREALRVLKDGRPLLLRLGPPDRLSAEVTPGVLERPMTCISGGTLEIYLEPHVAQPRLIAVSHLPIAEALAALGKGLGYAVTVVGLDASPQRFPQADLVLDRLDFGRIEPRPQTYIVVASHGNYDEEALAWALSTEAEYVALVASPTRARAVLDYLRGSGITEDRLARLKFPAGLDIGAVTPAEIALSILAETVQLRRAHAPPVVAGALVGAQPADTQPVVPSDAIDPVCGMTVEMAGARYTTQYEAKVYYFCCAGCQRSFEKQPQKYLS
jgi:xanthine dehydrogenase accessory factor